MIRLNLVEINPLNNLVRQPVGYSKIKCFLIVAKGECQTKTIKLYYDTLKLSYDSVSYTHNQNPHSCNQNTHTQNHISREGDNLLIFSIYITKSTHRSHTGCI
ncbi:hypothetical protein ILYODFUR_021057 [Ilyodon furcidens]|uniref:Uncharacterized protein n=1 Tax=Ilyodon furcidens TaxID=33524 RepID=A0ABV0U7S5_9TELE